MANVIDLVTKYLPILDEQYKLEAKSAILDTAPAFVQETKDAKKVKLAKMNVDGLADYSRNGGFTTGSMDLTWEEHEFTVDRGRALQVDALDNLETFGLAFGRLAGEFQRVKVVPEIDAYRFAKYYQNAGTQVAITVTAGAIMKFIDEADAQMDDDEVPEDGRILFVNPQVYKLMMNDPSILKYIDVREETDGNITKKVYWYNNHRIVKVPSTRFYTKIQLLTGTGNDGGFEPATGAEVIGILMIHPSATLQLAKRRIARVWAPTKEEAAGTDGVNPNADAWRFDFRIYHDAWIQEEKIAGIYGATVAGTDVAYVDAEDGSYDTSTSTWTAGGTDYHTKMLGATMVVTGEIPYAQADAVAGLPAGNRYTAKLVNSAITAKSALPAGNIVKILRDDGTYFEYTKDAFEDDGSLIVYTNVNVLRVKTIEIKWTADVTTTYVVNTLNATLEPAE